MRPVFPTAPLYLESSTPGDSTRRPSADPHRGLAPLPFRPPPHGRGCPPKMRRSARGEPAPRPLLGAPIPDTEEVPMKDPDLKSTTPTAPELRHSAMRGLRTAATK